MKYMISCVGLSLLVVLSARAETIAQDAGDWYQNHYAPLWKENPWDKVEDIIAFYDETIFVHPPDSPATVESSRALLTKSIEEWKSGGWLGSVVAEYQSDQLNSSTVVFKVKWQDWYTGDREEFSCGWYMADFKQDGWVFTQYADIDCGEHDL